MAQIYHGNHALGDEKMVFEVLPTSHTLIQNIRQRMCLKIEAVPM